MDSIDRMTETELLHAFKESESRYREIFRNTTDGMFIMDVLPEGVFRVVEFNPAEERITGYRSDDVAGKSLTEFLPASIAPKVGEHYNRCVREGKAISYHEEYDLANGHRAFLTSLVPLKADDGRVHRLLGISRDITDEITSARMLEESRELYRSLVESIHDVIFSTDSAGRLSYVSPVVTNLTGFTPEDLKGCKLIDLTHVEDRKMLRHIVRMRRRRTRALFECRLHCKNDSWLWVQVSLRPIFKDEVFIGANGILTDIDRQRKLETRIRSSERLESLGILAGGIAHDFNNLLSIVQSHSGILKQDDLSSEMRRESLQAIESAIARGARIVRQMLTFAKQTDSLMETLDLAEQTAGILHLLEETFPKTIRFVYDIAPGLPPVMGDSAQMDQLIMNLCLNARDAMSSIGGTLTVKLSSSQATAAEKPARGVELTISDTGPGMDSKTLQRVFEPFFTTKLSSGGTGLGLSTAYSIVQNHGGEIHIESQPESGTSVHVWLPSPSGMKATVTANIEEIRSVPVKIRATVLIVEDEYYIRKALEQTLAAAGIEVLCASSGAMAVALFEREKNRVDVVVTDLGLPEINGEAVCSRLRHLNPIVPIIVTTGYIEPERRQRLLAGGINDVVEKPYRPASILEIIERLLREPKPPRC